MGRLILLLLILATAYALWVAFRPRPVPPAIKGPDDDEEFLWKLERDARKKRQEDN
ncbi:hypothetical protein [Corynebacterium sp. 13CS0277]|uniref:hypothetical protein n=1 Tax=Corynebacterium sp. 13CS0277 TaxID=2071994 RepID=UPI0018EABA11|nr:hypothetical protein [Corynebacterium sp. 13CS0277]